MATLPAKSVRDSYGIDTYLRAMVWGMMSLRSLLVTTNNDDADRCNWAITQGSEGLGRFTGLLTLRYTQSLNTVSALDLVASTIAIAPGDLADWTDPATATPDLIDAIPSEPENLTLEQFLVWVAFALEYLSLPSTSTIKIDVQEANPAGATLVISCSLPYDRAIYLQTRNILEAAIDQTDPPTFSNSAIDWSRLVNIPASFPPTEHLHEFADIDGLSDALADKADLGTDGLVLPSQLPEFAVGSVEWTAVQNKPLVFPPDSHEQAIASVTGLSDALADKADLGTDGLVLPSQLPEFAVGSVEWSAVQNKPLVFPPDSHEQAIASVTGLSDALAEKADLGADGKVVSSQLPSGLGGGSGLIISPFIQIVAEPITFTRSAHDDNGYIYYLGTGEGAGSGFSNPSPAKFAAYYGLGNSPDRNELFNREYASGGAPDLSDGSLNFRLQSGRTFQVAGFYICVYLDSGSINRLFTLQGSNNLSTWTTILDFTVNITGFTPRTDYYTAAPNPSLGFFAYFRLYANGSVPGAFAIPEADFYGQAPGLEASATLTVSQINGSSNPCFWINELENFSIFLPNNSAGNIEAGKSFFVWNRSNANSVAINSTGEATIYGLTTLSAQHDLAVVVNVNGANQWLVKKWAA